MTKFKMIATDVDGTLVNSSKKIPSFTRSELRRVTQEYGVRLALVSTRMPRSLERVSDELQIDCSLIAYNGALVIPSRGEPPLRSTAIADSAAHALIEQLLLLKAHVGVFSMNRWFVSDTDYWALREARGTGIWPNRVTLLDAIADGVVTNVHKVMVRGEARAVREAIRVTESLKLGVSISRDSRDTVAEFTSGSISKGDALQALLDNLHIPALSVIAFGDGYSDISMLRLAGTGVAVDNSPGEVCASADYITLSNDEDGVGYALRKYFPTDECVLAFQE